jgi:hypothetical protein
MATAPARPSPEVAKVDYLIDENASRLNVPDDSGIRRTDDPEREVGATGPANWMRYGLIALGIVALLLLLMQLLGGGGVPTTDVVPGTPTTPPVSTPAAPAV